MRKYKFSIPEKLALDLCPKKVYNVLLNFRKVANAKFNQRTKGPCYYC